MKKLVFLCCLASATAQAETWELPPVMDNSGYPPQAIGINPTTNPAAPNSQSNAMYEMMARLEQLQKEVQALTGKVEEQAYFIAELKKQQKVMYGDFDERLQSIENKGNSATAPSNPEPNVADATPPAPVVTPQVPQADAAPAVVTEKPAPVPAVPAKKTDAKAVTPPPPATAKAPPPPQVPPAEKQDYDNALTALRSGRTSQAIDAFSAYLQKYSNTSYYSDDAQLHLGEAYRINKNNDEARKVFNNLINSKPKSNKVPEVLLKLGTIESEQKHTDKAREYFNRINKEFPTSSAAQRAAKKLELLQ